MLNKTTVAQTIKGICEASMRDLPTNDTWEQADKLLELIGIKQAEVEEIPLCWDNAVNIVFTIGKCSFNLTGIVEDEVVELKLNIDDDSFQTIDLGIMNDYDEDEGACLFNIVFN